MSTQRYSIVEPHPSVVPSKSYVTAGRGGAGNIHRAPANTTQGPSATGPASRASVIALNKPRSSFTTGRGGAGNVHPSSERAIFSFDEELERQLSQEKRPAPIYHVGRGGAGNFRNSSSGTLSGLPRRDSDSSSRSNTSVESGADIATRRFREGLKKMTGRA